MLTGTLIKGLDEKRLQKLLAVFFLALAIPTAILIWQAWSQLKFESFYQYRGAAEELTRRIDARLNNMIRVADARSFADYTFLVVSGDPSANFVQRSPLAEFPVTRDVAGVIGYFQVDNDGRFSTPLLPQQGADATSVGLTLAEYADRQALAQQINTILADNRLVQARPDAGSFDVPEPVAKEDADESFAAAAPAESGAASRAYSQQVFDRLNQPATAGEEGPLEEAQRRIRAAKVSELELDEDLQKKVEEAEVEGKMLGLSSDSTMVARERLKRREQIALPESASLDQAAMLSNVGGRVDLRISTFESEIDPFEFSVLDSGHFVLFRKVWRDGERYIQGLLVDQRTFIDDTIGTRFNETSLIGMSSLVVAYQDDVLEAFRVGSRSTYPDFAEDIGGDLLYRSRLTAPLDSLELIFSLDRLPPGAGGAVLGWVTVVLAVVFVAGFVFLYRLGVSQISLARQQQDFVSAVSHELKTPLTSIRMYGEMLKEGWADDDKRQSYYEFIHDESERLSRLISNVLELARITRNEPQFTLKTVNARDLMDGIEAKIASQVGRAGFELFVSSSDDALDIAVDVDEDCFAQIVINLVDNAIKFSKDAERKAIEIACKPTSRSEVVFSIRDYGPGIPRDQMQKIFELFYRSESELTRETVGTGIGLAIVHQLTAAMGGSVDVVNAAPGAEFRLSFPSTRLSPPRGGSPGTAP